MLIKYKSENADIKFQTCINFNLVNAFITFPDKTIRFFCGSENIDLPFESNELRDKAFEKIIDSYRWQRMTCEI